MNKSAKLRKYEKVYKKYVKESKKNSKKKSTETKPDKRSLNTYQKFVQHEIKKEKYKELPAKERMKAIALEWEKKKKGRKREEKRI